MRGRTAASDAARSCDRMNPSRASAMAGSTSRRQGSRPWSIQALCSPATEPGTPTAAWLSWWRAKS